MNSPYPLREIIIIDRRSVISALQIISLCLPKAILVPQQALQSAFWGQQIKIIWMLSHCGIPLNERADTLAKCVIDFGAQINWISPKDVTVYHKREIYKSAENQYRTNKYFKSQGNIPPINIKWFMTRRKDVLCSHLVTQIFKTPTTLHHFKMTDFNMCTSSQVGTHPTLVQEILISLHHSLKSTNTLKTMFCIYSSFY